MKPQAQFRTERIRIWVRQNRIMLTLGMIITLLIFWDAHPSHAFSYGHFLYFPPRMISEFVRHAAYEVVYGRTVFLNSGPEYEIAALTISAIAGFSVGGLVQVFWLRSQVAARQLALALLAVGMLCSCPGSLSLYRNTCIATNQDGVERDHCKEPQECLVTIQGIHTLRLLSYRYGDQGYFTYISHSTDGGQQYHQFARVFPDRPLIGADCGVDHLDESFFWIVAGDVLVLTNNGGETWRAYHERGTIQQVTFADHHNGTMRVQTTSEQGRRADILLYTTNGGASWQRQDEPDP